MYIPSKVLLNTQLNSNVYITEYFPITNRFDHGVVVPCNASGGISIIFAEVMQTYGFINSSCATSQPNQDRLLSRQEYEADLRGLIEVVSNKHQGRINFRIKDMDELYETYKTLHQYRWISGLINIVKDDLLNPVIGTEFTPAEGTAVGIGFETYIAAVKRDLPMLNLDYYTATHMYKNYMDSIKLEPTAAVEIPFLISCPNNQLLSEAIRQAAPQMDKMVITDILNNNRDDAMVNNYYSYMQMRYGIRERIARSLLLYHPSMINDHVLTVRRTFGILPESNRTTVWSTYKAPLTLVQQFNKDSMSII